MNLREMPIIRIVVIFLVLVSCTTGVITDTKQNAYITAIVFTPSSIEVTNQLFTSVNKTIVSTPTHRPTSTQKPASQRTQFETVWKFTTDTETVTETLEPTATVWEGEERLFQLDLPFCETTPIYLTTSPNKAWSSAYCQGKDGNTIIITYQHHGQNYWYFGSKPEEYPRDKDEILNLEDFHWSASGTYYYFKVKYWEFVGPYGEMVTGRALYRMDLRSGKVTTILPLDISSSFALSQDDNYLAYESKERIAVRNLSTFMDDWIVFDPKYDVAGCFLWSPDSKYFVATLIDYRETKNLFALVLVNRDTAEQRYIFKDNGNYLYAEDWLPNNRLLLVNGDYGSYWILDLNTEAIREVTPTPWELE